MNKDNNVVVSVLCLTYNHCDYIEKCLQGFVMQKTDFTYEVLVHDDASTDGTAEIIRRYAEKYPDIIKPILQNENQYSKGVGIIRTILFPRARGKYLAWCEGDDYWTDEYKLQKQCTFLENNDEYAMCVHRASFRYLKYNYERIVPEKAMDNDWSAEDVISYGGGCFATNSLMMRKDVYAKMPEIFRAKGFGDFQLFVFGTLEGRCRCLSDVMSVYNHGTPNSYTEKKLRDKTIQLRTLNEFIALFERIDVYTKGKYTDVIRSKKTTLQCDAYIMSGQNEYAKVEPYSNIWKERKRKYRLKCIKEKYPFIVRYKYALKRIVNGFEDGTMNRESVNKISGGLFWKLLERFGVQGVQFVLQIVLARILDPEHYGVLSLMVIFTTLANVFIQNGFNTALVQNKEVSEEDYSSVFWVSLGVAGVLYALIFFSAPFIASFYKMPDIVAPLRVLALMLFPGALNSVQLAKVSRELDFRKVFVSNIGGIVVSGVAGIVVAYMGGGLWALVVQTMLNVFVACIVMRYTVRLKIHLVCNLQRVKTLFSFGWKLLVSSLIDTLYQDLRSLVIGKKYDSGTLGYYNRGKQFPQFIINAVNGAVQSVMLPAMSANQDQKSTVKTMMRNSITLSAYIIFPMMAGLAGVATPLVSLLLTDKWLPCVPYMQVYCFTLAFYPVHSCNLQAINAMGRSDIFLKLEILKKSYGLLALIIAVVCFDSPLAIAMTGVFTTWISWFLNARPNKKLIGYSYSEQLLDIMPSFTMSVVMCACVLAIGTIEWHPFILILLQVIIGALVYIVLSMIFRPTPFKILLAQLQGMMRKKAAH